MPDEALVQRVELLLDSADGTVLIDSLAIELYILALGQACDT
jgi:hypothetical protein